MWVFKFEVWIRLGFTEKRDGAREHMYNTRNFYWILASHVTMPFHKCCRGWDCQSGETVPAPEVPTRLNLALSRRRHGGSGPPFVPSRELLTAGSHCLSSLGLHFLEQLVLNTIKMASENWTRHLLLAVIKVTLMPPGMRQHTFAAGFE